MMYELTELIGLICMAIFFTLIFMCLLIIIALSSPVIVLVVLVKEIIKGAGRNEG